MICFRTVSVSNQLLYLSVVKESCWHDLQLIFVLIWDLRAAEIMRTYPLSYNICSDGFSAYIQYCTRYWNLVTLFKQNLSTWLIAWLGGVMQDSLKCISNICQKGLFEICSFLAYSVWIILVLEVSSVVISKAPSSVTPRKPMNNCAKYCWSTRSIFALALLPGEKMATLARKHWC